MITIFSSSGELAVEPITGLVIKADSDYYGTDDLKDIQRFDIEEFCMFWGCEPQDGDILDFGQWYDAFEGVVDGYEPPAMNWRLETCIPFLLEDADHYDVLDQIGSETTPGELLELVNEGRVMGATPKEPQKRTK
jgi:hypothetical protein